MRYRLLKAKAPPEDELYQAFWELYRIHDSLRSCNNLLHSAAFTATLRMLEAVQYEPLSSLEALKRDERRFSVLLRAVKDDVVDISIDESAKLSLAKEADRFSEALVLLSRLTKIHVILQLHFELLVRYSERYEDSRLIRLSRLRNAFFESPTAEALGRYLTHAESLEERGVALNSFRVTIAGLRPGSQLRSTSTKELVKLRRELLDELWVHSVLEQLPRESKSRDLAVVLASRKPHPGVRFQTAYGAVPKRGA